MNPYLEVSAEVQQALDAGKPVVALESTIISHGMPYPQNVETALHVEQIIRDNGAVPATVAILGGKLKLGLTHEEIEYLGKKGQDVIKASRRDLAVLVSRGRTVPPPWPPPCSSPPWPGFRCLPPAASAASTGGLRSPWTSPPTWRSWPAPR